MNGYLLNFYKFTPSFNKEMEEISVDDYNRSIVWSNFDRLEVRKIDDFSQFRKSEVSEKSWLGERQFAMLYELNDQNCRLKYLDAEDKCTFSFSMIDDELEKNMRFFGITFIDFTKDFHYFVYEDSDGAKNDNIGQYVNEQLTKAINSIIASCNISVEEIGYEVYGILGGQDLAIVWLANQYEYIARIIHSLQISTSKNDKKIIANASTIVGLKDINNPNVNYENVTGHLFVKLTKRESFNGEQYIKDIREVLNDPLYDGSTTNILFGEHDILFEIPATKYIADLYKRDGLFHCKSKKFSDNFIQSKTEIVVKANYSMECLYKFPFEIESHHAQESIIEKEHFENLLRIVKNIVDSDWMGETPYLQETIWLLYEDFLKNITSSFTYPWSNDLIYQFEESMKYLQCLIDIDENELSKENKYEEFHNVIGSMQQMMLHVAQANRLFFEVPNTHLTHTGSYSKILHMYYGVVKKYLELAYDISKYDMQSSIIPFITFDVTPIAKSHFCEYIKKYDKNIVKIVLSYDALVNIPKYIKLLAHEVYHYIAPRDRLYRNNLVGAISFSLLVGQIAHIYMEEKLKSTWKQETLDNWLIIFHDMIRINGLNYFADNTGLLKKFNPGFDETSIWETYFNEFDSFFENIFFEKEECMMILNQWINAAIKDMNEKYDYVATIDITQFSNEIQIYKELCITPPLDRDIRYALREAAADYFMLQVTQMSLKEYLIYLNEYQDMMGADDDGLAQKSRKIFVIQLYIKNEVEEKINNIYEEAERNDEIYKYLIQKFGLDEAATKKLANDYIEITKAFQIYDRAISDYFEMFKFERIQHECSQFKKTLDEIQQLLCISGEESFYKNVKYVERFQKQKTLKELEKDIEDFGSVRVKRPNIDLSDIKQAYDTAWNNRVDEIKVIEKATSLSELLDLINKEIGKIALDGEAVWFRGHSCDKYLLIPSLYRMKDKKRYFYVGEQSKRQILNSLLDLFRVKAYNATELIDKMMSDDARTIAAMQHYKVPTNLLDWTTSVFPALYFALEKEINDGTCEDTDDAVIYILNPVRMNIIRNKLYTGFLNMRDYKQIEYPIPTIDGNKEIFDGFLPNRKLSSENSKLPIAGYIAYDNTRIKSQLGTFTIFGLDNQVDCYNSKIIEDSDNQQIDLSNCSILDMQNAYKKYCKSNADLENVEFITKVVINGDDKKKIGKELRNLGITKARYYPELDNISEELTLQIKKYMKTIENI